MKKYFVSPKERNGSCYHEFFKGKWDKKTLWKEDSLCIHDNMYTHEFCGIMSKYVTGFSPFGINEVTKSQWEQVNNECIAQGGVCEELVNEISQWVEETFCEYDVFTILGI